MSGYNPDHTSPLKGVVSYSPADKTWRSHAELPSNNSWGAAASINGNLLAIGGAVRNRRPNSPSFEPLWACSACFCPTFLGDVFG